jgi:hypothetical protein
MHTLRFEEHGAPSVQRGEVAVVDAEVLESSSFLSAVCVHSRRDCASFLLKPACCTRLQKHTLY